LYDPPISEFAVVKIDIPAGERERHLGMDGPSIAVVMEGKGSVVWGGEERLELELGMGDVVYVGAGIGLDMWAGGDGLVLYRAFVEIG